MIYEPEGVFTEHGERRFDVDSPHGIDENWKGKIVTENIIESPVTLEEYEAMDRFERRKAQLKVSKISQEELEAHIEYEKGREEKVPAVGSIAPDFIAEVLELTERGRVRKSSCPI